MTAGQDHLVELYLDAIELELAGLGTPRPVETRFIGGGTPTYLTPPQLDRLLTAITRWLPMTDARNEFSIESTPESLDDAKAEVLAAHGINRVSLGVQSFHTHLLGALDRRHDPGQIPPAVAATRRHIPDLSFDLIFGTPGQTPAEWERDLAAVLAFEPGHISTYGLTYEKGTPLWKDRERGRLTPVDEDAELAMYETAMDHLTAAGFEQYEISNFARPGRRSRHNERYWANDAYYGFGTGAARYVGGVRELNVRDTKLYVRRVLAGESPTFQSECLDPRERAVETITTQLRRADGIDRDRFHEQTGFVLDDLAGPKIVALTTAGVLSDDGLSVTLTRRGKCLADAVVLELLKAAG